LAEGRTWLAARPSFPTVAQAPRWARCARKP